MIIIVEGPDGAGKTTFARAFGSAAYKHFGPPPDVPNLGDYYQEILLDAHKSGLPTVIDRMAMSEIVYGPVLRGASKMDRESWRQFDELAKSIATTVVCLPPYAVCLNAWRQKAAEGRELISDPDVFHRVYHHFLALSKGYHTYDWTAQR